MGGRRMPPAAGGRGKETFKESPLDLSEAKAGYYETNSPSPWPHPLSFKPFYPGGRCRGQRGRGQKDLCDGTGYLVFLSRTIAVTRHISGRGWHSYVTNSVSLFLKLASSISV